LFSAMMNIGESLIPVVDHFERENLPYTLVALEVPGSADGYRGYFESIGAAGWTGTSITTNCVDVEAAARFLAYVFSREGIITSMFGIEGTTYTWGADGRIQWMDGVESLRVTDSDRFAELYGEDFWISNQAVLQQQIQPLPTTRGGLTHRMMAQNSARYAFNELAQWNTRPTTGSDESVIETLVNQTWDMYWPQIVTANSEEEAIALWETANQELNNLGLDRLIAYRNVLFQRNKQNLGIEFMYPGNR